QYLPARLFPRLRRPRRSTLFPYTTLFRSKARCVPSVRVPVPSAADGSAAPPAEPFDVLLLIQESTEAVTRAVVELPVFLAWLVPQRMPSMSRLSSMPLSISW